MTNTKSLLLVVMVMANLFVSCAISTPTAKPAEAASAGPVLLGVGLDAATIDISVSPCDDFFQFASRTWLKNNPIPAAESRWSSFDLLVKQNEAIMRTILEESATHKGAAKGSNAQKVGDFYASGMDSTAIEKAGLKYLQPELDSIRAVKDLKGLQAQLGRQLLLTRSIFRLDITEDRKKGALYLSQGGLTLPNLDYYLNDDTRAKAIRTAYTTYLTNTFRLLGDNEVTALENAATVLRLEMRLAKASRNRIALRDSDANHNKMTLRKAARQFPHLGLPTMLQQLGLGSAKKVIVGQPEFLQEASAALKQEPLADWKTYLRWRVTSSLVSALPSAYVEESFRFQQVLTGIQQQRPRWQRILRATDANLGEAFGQLYVDKAFPPETKQKALEMVGNIKEAMGEHIRSVAWMSPSTKKKALNKLNAFTIKIGYPDQWKDYSTLRISRDSYLRNLLAAQEWKTKGTLQRFGKPIDRTVWTMTPPTVNAYYNPALNEIVFPAGIMQPPFFDPKADDAVNYGGIGAIIGHEITHGFDDQGRKSDARGVVRNWWTKKDAAEFIKRANMVEAQYSAFQPFDSVYVNGKLTMGENLADLGGLSIAFTALQKQLKKQYGSTPRPRYDGFTPEQRFFLAWAQASRANIRPEALRQQILTDVHAPDQYRTIGPLMNMPEFYRAFDCREGQKMVRSAAQRAKIW